MDGFSSARPLKVTWIGQPKKKIRDAENQMGFFIELFLLPNCMRREIGIGSGE